MINKKIYGVMAAGVLACGLTACQSEVEPALPDGPAGKALPVEVCALVEGDGTTRASGTSWDKGDAIGINVYSGSSYVSKYKKFISDLTANSATSSTFSAASASDQIYFYSDGTWTFDAYYPGTATVNDGEVAINSAADCTSKNVDFMWASGATASYTDASSTNPKIYFDGSGAEGHGSKFKHVMSRVMIRVHVGDGITDEDITLGSCMLRDLFLEGLFYLCYEPGSNFNGLAMALISSGRKNLQLVENGTGKSGVSFGAKTDDYYPLTTMYLIPQYLESNWLSFGLKLRGVSGYQYCNAKMSNLEGGKSYELDVIVNKTGISVTDCRITNWITGNTVSGTLK